MYGRREVNGRRERSFEGDERTHRYRRTEPAGWASTHRDIQRRPVGNSLPTYAEALKRGLREKNYDRQDKHNRDHNNYSTDSEQYNVYEDFERNDDEWARVRAGPGGEGRRRQAWQPHPRRREDAGGRNRRGEREGDHGRNRWWSGSRSGERYGREEQRERGWVRATRRGRGGDDWGRTQRRYPGRVRDGDDHRDDRRQVRGPRPDERRRDRPQVPGGDRRRERADSGRRVSRDDQRRGASPRRGDSDDRTGPEREHGRGETQVTDPTFTRQVRTINKLIKAVHHFKNVTDANNPPLNIGKMTKTLKTFIKPASPTEKTLDLIEENAKSWGERNMTILRDHYYDVIKEQTEEFINVAGDHWEAPFQIAVKWAKRGLGRKLSTDTIDQVEAILIAELALNRQIEQNDTPDVTDTSPPAPKPRKRDIKMTSYDTQTDTHRETLGPTPPPPPPSPPPPPPPSRARQGAAPPAPPDDVEPAPSEPAMTTRVQRQPPRSTNVVTSTADANPARQGCKQVRTAAWVYAAPRQGEILSPTASRANVMCGDEQSEWEREGEMETSEGETSEKTPPSTSYTTSQQDTLWDTSSSGVVSDACDDITQTGPPQKKSTPGPPLTKLEFTWEELQEWTTPTPPRVTRSTVKKMKKSKRM